MKASGDDENIRIEVNDDGPGIPPTHKGTARFPSIRTLVEADLRVWLPVMAVILDEEKIQQILADAEKALSAYVDEHGQAVFSVSAHIITGTK